MSNTTLLVIVLVAVAVIAVLLVAFFVFRRQRGQREQQELRERRERVEGEVRPLSEERLRGAVAAGRADLRGRSRVVLGRGGPGGGGDPRGAQLPYGHPAGGDRGDRC